MSRRIFYLSLGEVHLRKFTPVCVWVQMIGFMEATQGEAIINGRNIKTDMNEIYTFMVRPPHASYDNHAK